MRIVSFANDSPDRFWRLDIPKKWIEARTEHRLDIYGFQEWIHHLNNADVVIGRSFISPVAVKLVHAFGKKIIYELDGVDAYYPSLAQKLHDIKIKQGIINLQKETIRTCDGVLVATKPIQEWVESFYSGPIMLFPSYMDFEWWNSNKKIKLSRKKDGQIRIGCLGMPSHNSDIRSLLVPVMHQVLLSYPNAIFYFPETVKTIIPKTIRENSVFIKPWKISDRPLLARRLGINIMLVPLLKNKFNACKTAIKYFENAADKIPGLYSPTVYKDYVVHNKTGLIASNIKEWVIFIGCLINDRKFYNYIAQNSFEDVRKNYAASRLYKNWLDSIFYILKYDKKMRSRFD